MMSTTDNKQRMQEIFAALAQGDSRPFLEAMADDFRWVLPGRTAWSRTYEGKEAVRKELFAPLFAQFADQYTSHARRIIAEGEHVVVEAQGQVTTRKGAAYNNTYCYIFRLRDGQMREVTEYMDTQLLAAVLDDPA